MHDALAWLDAAVRANELTEDTARNIQRWLAPAFREYHQPFLELIARRDAAELTRLFWTRIPFGTGGRRGAMAELGSATMNRRTIAESAHGLAVYVKRLTTIPSISETRPSDDDEEKPGFGNRPASDCLALVIAYDTRLRSREFAEVTASVMAAHGFRVYFYPAPRATPQLSFSVRGLGCQCGVMISASHNPPDDNGFKAYWSHGGQVLPPHDRGIIECVDAADDIPSENFAATVATGRIVMLGDDIDRQYLEAVCAQSLSSDRSIRALYTPLHGVGESSVYRVLRLAGFEGVEIFEPQRSQDGRFPNVPDHLPNPERPAAFGPAIEAAKAGGYDVVLASDPDADRIAVAVRQPDGSFACLTGNQLAALLTDYALAQRRALGTLSPEHYVLETLVTTPLVETIARSYGVDVVSELPVGFKTMAAVVEERGAERFVFATEESIGYMAGDYCRDKDAALGALWTLELAALLKRRGQTLCDRLRELYRQYGVHLEAQVSREFPGPTGVTRIAALIRRFREQPPARWGDVPLHQVRDYGRHEVRSLPDNSATAALAVSAGDLLLFDGAGGGLRLTVALRPSGTEPKIKFYIFVQAPPEADVDRSLERSQRLLNSAQLELQAWLAG